MSIPSVLERGAKTPQTPAREDLELQWYRTVYRGDDVPQLTLRAVLMGAGLGMFMSLSNLYVGLKTGWGLGVAITACILSFAIWRTLMTVLPRVFRTPMTILENNCMQSTASSAGYATGATLVSAIPACLLITGHHLSWPVLMFWTLSVGSLGVFMAIPMKRQMINVEQLRFPSGIAAAETLKSLHSTGADAVHKARALGIGGLFGALIAWLRDAGKPFAIPSSLPFPGGIGGFPLTTWTINFELSAVMIAAGAIMGWKVAWSLLAGATINYAVLAPWMASLGVIDTAKLGYREIVRWSTWTGASIMVSSALLMFAFQWRTVGRALGGITATLRKKVPTVHDPLRRIEVPGWWFLAGSTLSGVGCLAVLFFAFSASIYLGIFAVALTFLLSVVVCRATGESDIAPLGAMGKITQLMFGVLAPANVVTNLLAAGVTAGAAVSSADLLTDLKSGYVLGANPRKQFLAQFFGVFAGTLVVVPAFYLLIPDASVLGTDRWPAPAAQVWSAVAKLLASGFTALHPTARAGLLIGGLFGLLLPTLSRLFPRANRFIPSAMGLGLAMVIPFYNSLSMFLGALIVLVLEKAKPALADKYVIPVSSGIIAGESLLGIAIALLLAGGILQ